MPIAMKTFLTPKKCLAPTRLPHRLERARHCIGLNSDQLDNHGAIIYIENNSHYYLS